MGFDIHGVAPLGRRGEYFRNNVWGWRPLWAFVCQVCDDILTDEDKKAGNFNDCYLIDEHKAEQIAERLFELIKNGGVQAYDEGYARTLDELPDEACKHCNQGKSDDGSLCHVCDGKGEVRPFATNYAFDPENVREFAEFCQDSGGFEIC